MEWMWTRTKRGEYASVCVENNRAQHPDQVVSVERQIEAVRDALGSICARPVATIASELATVKSWRKRHALEAELSEAKPSV